MARNLETDDLTLPATLWLPVEGPTGLNEYAEPYYNTPIGIMCRWGRKKSTGGETQSDATAIESSLIVNRVIPQKAIVWIGKRTSLPADLNAAGLDFLEVIGTTETYDVKGNNKRFRATVKRSSTKAPEMLPQV